MELTALSYQVSAAVRLKPDTTYATRSKRGHRVPYVRSVRLWPDLGVVSGFGRTWDVVSGFSRTWGVVSGFSRTWDVESGFGRTWDVVSGFSRTSEQA
jgi:hypothetical protein